MAPLLDGGLAVGVSSAEEFIEILDSLDEQPIKEDMDGFKLWEDNAKKNASDMVLEILKSR